MYLPFEQTSSPHPPPIIISGTSPLRVAYDGGWTQVDGRTLVTPFPGNTIADVVVSVGIKQTTISPPDSKPHNWLITFDFNSPDHQPGSKPNLGMAVQTDPEGGNVRLVTRCDADLGKQFLHNETTYQTLDNALITNLKVYIDGTAVSSCPSSASSIEINFNIPASLLRLLKLLGRLKLPDGEE